MTPAPSVDAPARSEAAADEDGQSRPTASLSPTKLALVVAVAVAIGIAGIALRTAALSEYSPLPAGFDGPRFYRVQYVFDHGHLLTDSVPIYSFWSGGVNTRLGSYFSEVYEAGLLGISKWLAEPTRMLQQIILTTALVGLSVWLLVRRRPHVRIRDVALVASLATLGTPLVIYFISGWNVAYGWVLLLAVTAVVVSPWSTRTKVVLTLALTLLGPPVYHSFGFLLVTYVVALWILGRIVHLRGFVVSPVPVLVAYAAYQIYVSIQFFGELVTTARDVLTLAFLGRDVGVITLTPASFMGVQLRDVHLVLYSLLAIPIAIQGLRYLGAIRRKPAEGRSEDQRERLLFWTATASLAAAIGIFGLAFGARFNGEQLITRGANYVIVPAVVGIIAELRYRPRFYQYVYPIGAVVLLLSGFAFWGQSTTVYAGTQIKWSEAQGYEWLSERLSPDDVVWTDFRLSAPFIADGHFRVIGIHGQENEPTNQLLDSIYYESTPGSIGAAIDQVKTYDGKAADFVFLSTLMTQTFPSLNGYGTQFRPLPTSFFDTIGASPAWMLVYKNDLVRIYGRRNLPSGLNSSGEPRRDRLIKNRWLSVRRLQLWTRGWS